MKTFKLLLLILATLSCAVVTSCGDDEPNPVVDNNLRGVYTISFLPTENNMELCDIEITYINEKGINVTELVTGKYTHKITYSKFPSDGGFTVTQKLKKGVHLSGSYTLGYSYKTYFETINSKGEVIDSDVNQGNNFNTVSAENVGTYVERHSVILKEIMSMEIRDGKIYYFTFS